MSSVTRVGFHSELQITVRTKESKEKDGEDRGCKEEGQKCKLALVFGVPSGAFFDVDQLKGTEGILEVWVDDDVLVNVEQPSFTARSHAFGLVYMTSTSTTTSYASGESNNETTRFREVSLCLPVHLRYPCPGDKDYAQVEVNLRAVELKCGKNHHHQLPTTPFNFSTLASAPRTQCTVPFLVPAGRIHHMKFVQWATPFVAVVGAAMLILGMWWWHPISHCCSKRDGEVLVRAPEKKKTL